MEKTGKVAIIGAGMMASGISLVCARAGYRVALVDIKRDALERAAEVTRSRLNTLARNEIISVAQVDHVLANITGTMDLDEAVRDTDIAIESVPEVLEFKQRVFRQMDELCPPRALLATATSTLSITDIASVTSRTERVIGLHWVNPPYLCPRVEVNRGEKTSDETVREAQLFVLQLGQIPVVTRKDIPGFVGARLRTVLVNEALSLVEQGVISVEDVDNMVRFGLAIQILPHGPLRAFDLTGAKSLSLTSMEYIYSHTGETKYRPPQILRDKADTGELPWIPGEKRTAKGWYDYTGESPEAVVEKRDTMIAKTVKLLEELGIIELERQRIKASIASEAGDLADQYS